MFGFYLINTFQEGNITRLKTESFSPINLSFSEFVFLYNYLNSITENMFNSLKHYIEIKYFYTTSFLEIEKIFFSSKNNETIYQDNPTINAIIKDMFIYNEFLQGTNFTLNLDSILFPYLYETTIGLCIYNNIFLSTYLAIIFILINLSFKITAAPFHF